ncbi:hypothetical protein TrVE_jg12323 [Triparma verrucosa]|uniref:NAD(P)-binding protein n=2 Tax=Triparma verrucosa TaxID=1606542 RepID=A0A9W7F6M6_9STRA|nr:hypothetical protein TrVE_jg12323 [Triparma verrucosa]
MSKPISSLIVGCSGSLGRAFPPALPSLSSVISVDLSPPPSPRHPLISAHLPLPPSSQPSDLTNLLPHLDTAHSEKPFDLIINTGGSWSSGPFPPPSSPHSTFTTYLTSTESMLSSNLNSSIFSCGLATRYLTSTGHLILTGAHASLTPSTCSSFMPGYGLSKNGVKYLAEMLRGLNPEFKVSVVHPRTLDTEANRSAMPEEDFGGWVRCEELAGEVMERLVEGGEEGDWDVVKEGGVTRLVKL